MEYVCSGAMLKCSKGTFSRPLKATPKNVTLMGKDQANVADNAPVKNIPPFGPCHSRLFPRTAAATAANHGVLTPMPCRPRIISQWKAIDPRSLVCGKAALLRSATLKCVYGGTISIVSPGQDKEVK